MKRLTTAMSTEEFNRLRGAPMRAKKEPVPSAVYIQPKGEGKGSESVIRFTIPGKPIGAPRMTRRDKWKKRPCVVRYHAWRDSARLAAGKLPAVNNIASVSWTAFFSPPASWSKSKRAAALGELHRTTPDRDNVDKSLLDALFIEDSAIAHGTIEKRWGEPERLEVEIVLTPADLKD